MVDASGELRATSDLMLLDLDALGDLEEQKRVTPHGDPKLIDLAGRIEEIAQRVLVSSRRQRELTEAVTQDVESGAGEPATTIEGMRSVTALITDWREAERAAGESAVGSRERADAEAMVDRFREEYRLAFEAARRNVG
jgi:hypothetical protein